MKIADVHAHLDSSRFKKDLDDVISRFKTNGGELIITSGVNPATNIKALEISKKYDCVKPSFGLYPVDALVNEIRTKDNYEFLKHIKDFDVDDCLSWIKKHKNDCVAVGEIGLDYNSEELKTEFIKEKQKENFRKVLKMSKKIDKVVVIHSRKAESDAIDLLEEMGMKKVVMHCFNGKKSLIRRCVQNGWSFSVPPVITRLEHFKMLSEIVPLENLLTETDSPYLSPVVGERNEPANVNVTIEVIARIKKTSKDEVAKKIWENTEQLFKI